MKEAFTTTARLFYDPEQKLLKIIITEGAHIGIQDVRNHFRVSRLLTEGKKVRVLSDSRANYSITAEARDEAAKLSREDRAATAIVSSNPVSRFISNLYIRFSKPNVPTRLFESESEAMAWLDQFR